MKKSKLVKEIIGKAIEKYGFSYGLPKHYSVGVCKQTYFFMLDGKLPMNNVQILEYQSNKHKYFV